jgi:NDP-sugar pyrophosphorylase family protein
LIPLTPTLSHPGEGTYWHAVKYLALAAEMESVRGCGHLLFAFSRERRYMSGTWAELSVIAVVLAAGRGTRMGPLTANVPKPLLALRGRPIIEHILTGLHAAGIREVVVVTGYLAEQIERHLGSGEALRMRLSYRRQTRPEGTARALLLARDAIRAEPFLLSWGDIVVEPGQYAALLDDYRRVRCDALLSVNATEDPWQGAAVYVDEHWRVTSLVEKPPRGSSRTPWNNAGIFVLAPLVLEYAERLSPSPRGEYELPQAIAAMIADGRDVRACPVRGFWSDLGRPEDLAVAESALENPSPSRNFSPSPSETVDKREPHPSRRSQRKGPPQGERKLSFENNNRTARPEEPPPEEQSVPKGSGGVSKGARWRRSTVPSKRGSG